jgi:cation diffusion facilitator family transporter
MFENKVQDSNDQIRNITKIGIVCNLVLTIAKIIIGFWASSIALLADGLHSFSDIATDFVVLLGIHYGSKAPDKKHQYGHGRLETFASGVIATVLVVVGGAMIYSAAINITESKHINPSKAVIFVAFISILAKELLYQATRKVAIKSHSTATYANAWHHRSDALSSVAVVIGHASMYFGFEYGDHIAAVGVGLMIIFVGVQILGQFLREVTETSVDENTINLITKIINSNSSIRDWHKLRTRTVGRELFLDLHILVDPSLSISAAHDISEKLENAIHEQIHRPVNIMVHIEPAD